MKSLRIVFFLLSFFLLPSKAMADWPYSVFEVICDAYVFQFSYGIRGNFPMSSEKSSDQPRSFFPSATMSGMPYDTSDWQTYTCIVEGYSGEEGGWEEYKKTKYELIYKQVNEIGSLGFDVLAKVKVNGELAIPEISLFKQCLLGDETRLYGDKFVRMTFDNGDHLTIDMGRYGTSFESESIRTYRDSIPHIPSFCQQQEVQSDVGAGFPPPFPKLNDCVAYQPKGSNQFGGGSPLPPQYMECTYVGENDAIEKFSISKKDLEVIRSDWGIDLDNTHRKILPRPDQDFPHSVGDDNYIGDYKAAVYESERTRDHRALVIFDESDRPFLVVEGIGTSYFDYYQHTCRDADGNAVAPFYFIDECVNKELIRPEFPYHAFRIKKEGGGWHGSNRLLMLRKDEIPRVSLYWGEGYQQPWLEEGEDGQYIMKTQESSYAYWPFSYAASAFPELAWRIVPSGFTLAPDLMITGPPDKETLNELRQEIKEDFDGEDIPYPLYATVLDLIYSGNEDVAWEFFDQAWPSDIESKQDFKIDFIDQICSSAFAFMLYPSAEGAAGFFQNTCPSEKLSLPDGSTYGGQVRNGQAHGNGVHTFANGDTHQGTFENGLQHGWGTYTFAYGSMFRGEFKDGKPWEAQYYDESGRELGMYKEGVFTQSNAESLPFQILQTRVNLDPQLPGAVIVKVHLINHTTTPRPYPAIQLTLTDRAGETIGKRTYTEGDYGTASFSSPAVIDRVEPNAVAVITLHLASPDDKTVGFEATVVSPDELNLFDSFNLSMALVHERRVEDTRKDVPIPARTESSPWDCLNDEDVKESAELWGHNPEQAIAFGKKIQEAVSEKDIKKLASLIDNVFWGPTDKWSDIFGDKLLPILSEPAPCQPHGWRGFGLANGLIWYQYIGDGPDDPEGFWEIWAINDWIGKPEPFPFATFPSWVANIDELISGTWTISEFRAAGITSGGNEERANQLIGETIKVENDDIYLPDGVICQKTGVIEQDLTGPEFRNYFGSGGGSFGEIGITAAEVVIVETNCLDKSNLYLGDIWTGDGGKLVFITIEGKWLLLVRN
jgi:hypothetical protein